MKNNEAWEAMQNTKDEINKMQKMHKEYEKNKKNEIDKMDIGIYKDGIDIYQQIENLENYIRQQKMMEKFHQQQVDNQRYETNPNIKPVSSLESTTKSLKERQDFIQVLEKRLLLLKEKVNIEKNKNEKKVDIKNEEIEGVILNNKIEKINVNNEEDLVNVYNHIIDSQFAEYKSYLEKKLEDPIIKKALDFKNEENQLEAELKKLLSNLEKEKQFKIQKDQEIDKITLRQVEIEKIKNSLGFQKSDKDEAEDIKKEYQNNILAIKQYIGYSKVHTDLLVELENKIQKVKKDLESLYIDNETKNLQLKKKEREINDTLNQDLKDLSKLELEIKDINQSKETMKDEDDLEDLNHKLSVKSSTVQKLQEEIKRQKLELLQIKEELKTAKEIESALPAIKKIQLELALIKDYNKLSDEQKNDIQNRAMIHYGVTEEQLENYKFSTADEKYNLIHREEIAAEKLRNEQRQKEIEERNKIIAEERRKQEEEIRKKQEEERKLKEEIRKKQEEEKRKQEEIKKALDIAKKREDILKNQKEIENALRKAQEKEAKEKQDMARKKEFEQMKERLVNKQKDQNNIGMSGEVQYFLIPSEVFKNANLFRSNACVGNFEIVRQAIANSNKKLSSMILAAKDPFELYKVVVGDSKLCKLYFKMIVPTEKLNLKIAMYNAQLEAASATSNKEKREKLLGANDVAEFGKICADSKGYGATMKVYKKFLEKTYLPKHENISLDDNSKYYFVQALRLLVKENHKKEIQLALLNVNNKNSYDSAVYVINQEKNQLQYNPDSGLKGLLRRMIGSN